MDNKKIFWLTLSGIIILLFLFFSFKHCRNNAQLPPKAEPAQIQESTTVVTEEPSAEEVNKTQDIKENTAKTIQPKKYTVKQQSKVFKKEEKKSPLVNTVVEGNSIKIVTPKVEQKPVKVEVPQTEPRTDIVDVKYEYRTKTPRKYIFR